MVKFTRIYKLDLQKKIPLKKYNNYIQELQSKLRKTNVRWEDI